MASSSTAFFLKEAGFHVKNVPKEWNDWNLFHVFQKYGRVGYCRVAAASHDANSQLGFVNMLSLEDADKVRKNLSDGWLNGEDFSLRINEHKPAGGALAQGSASSGPAPKLPTSPIAKNVPVILSSMWLPLNKEIEVEVVDFLPSCSAMNSALFELTVIQINDAALREKYDVMHDKMSHFSQLTPFETELQIGHDGLLRDSARQLRRVRRISANKLYLLDFGRTVQYEKNKCFQLPKVFQSLPTRVSMCGLDGLKWTEAAIQSFDKIRDVVKQWSQMEQATLHAVCQAFSGPINLINLFCGKSILAERLQQKGACEYIPRHDLPRYAYSRECLLEHKSSGTSTANISSDEDVKSLLQQIKGVKNMLRELNE